MQRTIQSFKIKDIDYAVPTIELRDSTTLKIGYGSDIRRVLVNFAKKNPKKNVSIFSLYASSYNFGDDSSSFFLIIPKAQNLLKEMYKELKAKYTDDVRYGEYLEPQGMIYHIQDGQAWQREDLYNFSLLELEEEK